MAVEAISVRTDAAWKRARSKDVTASVAGALFGVHEFVTRYELWMLKSGRIHEDQAENDAMKRGRLLEPVAVALLREQRPHWKIAHNTGSGQIYFRDPEARLGCTPDVLIEFDDASAIVQVKSVEASTFRKKWLQDDGSVEPPLWIVIQANIEAHLTGAERAFVAPLVVSHTVEMPLIEVPLHRDLMETLKAECREFWRSVDADEEPSPDFRLDAHVIDRMFGRGASEEAVDFIGDERAEELVGLRHSLKRTIADAEKDLAAVEAEIKFKMEGADIAYLSGGRSIRWSTIRRLSPDGKPIAYRVLRMPDPA